jgi:hypothetical protein
MILDFLLYLTMLNEFLRLCSHWWNSEANMIRELKRYYNSPFLGADAILKKQSE